MRQADIFLETEGDAWFARNADKIGTVDLVSEAIENAKIEPARVLEVGCANGWRLAKLRAKYDCEVLGIDPSRAACMQAAQYKVPALQTTASCLPVDPRSFDMVIYAFCLYLTDPLDWLSIAAEGDRSLVPGGHIVIHDFDFGGVPQAYARRYKHDHRVLAYHADFARLWLSHPLYERVWSIAEGGEEVTILRKHPAQSIEVRP